CLQFMEELIAASWNIEPPGHAGVETQAAEIAHATGLAVDEALTDGATADAYDTSALAGDDGLFHFARQIRIREIIRLALERKRDLAGHWVFPDQATDLRTIVARGE